MDGAHCDYAIFVGAAVDNARLLPDLSKQAFALKMYLNETFTSLRLDSMETWMEVGGAKNSLKVCHCVWMCYCSILNIGRTPE